MRNIITQKNREEWGRDREERIAEVKEGLDLEEKRGSSAYFKIVISMGRRVSGFCSRYSLPATSFGCVCIVRQGW